MTKRRIFISFDHDDTAQVSGFMGLRKILDSFDFYNHKLDRRIQSTDVAYVHRVIREDYIKPASVTVVLIGNKTAQSSWVRWEIEESRRQGKGLPEGVSAELSWSQLIDSWMVDWSYATNGFAPSWRSYRTRKDREISLQTPAHDFSTQPVSDVQVKVLTVWGDEIVRTLRVEC